MLSVNSPKPDIVIETFDKRTIEGCYFEVVKKQGLSVLIKTDCNEREAAAVLKRVLADLPAMKYKMTNVVLVNEQGIMI